MEPVVLPYPIEEITIVHNGRRLKQLKLNKAKTKIVIRILFMYTYRLRSSRYNIGLSCVMIDAPPARYIEIRYSVLIKALTVYLAFVLLPP